MPRLYWRVRASVLRFIGGWGLACPGLLEGGASVPRFIGGWGLTCPGLLEGGG